MKRSLVFSASLMLLFASLCKAQTPQRLWSVAMADTFMRRNPGTPHDSLAPWSYWKGYTLLGFEKLGRATGDKKYFDFIQREIDPFIDEKGHLRNVTLDSLDNTMSGNVVVGLYEQTHDPRYRIAATEIRRAFDSFPRNPDGGFWHSTHLPGEMWIDGVFMGQMFLLRYGKSIGDRAYCFDEAARQILVFASHARQNNSGLYYHAWASRPELAKVIPEGKKPWADPKTGLSSEVWSEGLGWYALVLVEALADLPPDHPRRPQVLDVYRRLAAGLKRVQDPRTGGWFQVVDKGSRPDNWIDTSGTSMFTYSLQRGIELGLLDRAEYAPVVSNGYGAITGNARINAEGLVDLSNTCDGVCVQAGYSDYVNYPRVLNAKEAVAGFLWATTIVEKKMLEKKKF
ncbi:MAG TPA: glycoside hydrolase family 88 protein [Dongiaceae bacterium]|nr:glycoside hydrolase family 88 protein [Dongiaceae bacterium]